MQVAENQMQKKKIEELVKVNETLQQQRQIDARDIEQLKGHLESVKKQRDDANKECKNAMVGKSKAIKEKQRMYEERNTALHEYNLIMSERDSVHKEIERLNEDLGTIVRRNETLEKENKTYSEELESLKRELASALMDRDRALKLSYDLKQKYGELQQQRQQSSIYGTLDGTSNSNSGHYGTIHAGAQSGAHYHHGNSGHGYYSTETATANSSSSSLMGHGSSAVSPSQFDHHHHHHHHSHQLHQRIASPPLNQQQLHYQGREPLRATLKGINHLSNSSMSSVTSNPFKLASSKFSF